MSQLVIHMSCDTENFRDGRGAFAPEPEIAYVLMRFVADISSWGTLPADGRPIELRDSGGNMVGTARLEIGIPASLPLAALLDAD